MVKPSPLLDPETQKKQEFRVPCHHPSLLLNDVALFGNVQTVQELKKKRYVSKCYFSAYLFSRKLKYKMCSYLSDILVADLADLLNIGSALRDTLQRVTSQDELILL